LIELIFIRMATQDPEENKIKTPLHAEIYDDKHLYGKIIHLLFNNPYAAFLIQTINHHLLLPQDDKNVQIQLDDLVNDGLVKKEGTSQTQMVKGVSIPMVSTTTTYTYRITHKGYQYVKDLESSKNNRNYSKITLYTTLTTLLLTIASFIYSIVQNNPPVVNVTVTPDTVYVKTDTLKQKIIMKHDTIIKIAPSVKVKTKK
jgi:hypothetical protein